MATRDPNRLVENQGQDINVGESERWASFILGGMLTLFGIQRRSLGGALLAFSGASLIHRAVTGHCYTYEAFDVDTSDIEPNPAPRRNDEVLGASEDSFPASDAPAWTGTTSVGGPHRR